MIKRAENKKKAPMFVGFARLVKPVKFFLVRVQSLKRGNSINYQFDRALSHDVMAAILVFQNNETAAMLVYQTSPVGVGTFYLCKLLLLFQ